MKNRKLVYILVPLLLAIWGTIVYRLLNVVTNKDISNKPDTGQLMAGNKTSACVDTFTLTLNYPDPFFVKMIKRVAIGSEQSLLKVIKPEKKVVATPQAATFVWPTIIYGGLVKNQKLNKLLALIQINGSATIMQTGDIAQELKLLKVTNDSIEIAFHTEKRVFRK